jgi:hypothetical protein
MSAKGEGKINTSETGCNPPSLLSLSLDNPPFLTPFLLDLVVEVKYCKCIAL